jgi:hypothetical protein
MRDILKRRRKKMNNLLNNLSDDDINHLYALYDTEVHTYNGRSWWDETMGQLIDSETAEKRVVEALAYALEAHMTGDDASYSECMKYALIYMEHCD